MSRFILPAGNAGAAALVLGARTSRPQRAEAQGFVIRHTDFRADALSADETSALSA